MMRGVQRTVAVFECFSPQRPSLTLQQISDGIRLPKSTTFRVVQSLEEAGYVIRLEDQKYCLSFRFTRLAGMVISTLNIRQVARPMMVELSRRTNETIALNTVSGDDRVCIDSIDTPSPLMSLARPGQSLPLDDKGAIHKTLLAHLPKKVMEKRVGQLTKGNARKRPALVGALARVREDGYCISHGERVLGLSAMAAPIWDSNDAADYCVTLTAPTVRMKPNTGHFLELLLKTAGDISRQLGGHTVPLTVRGPGPRRQNAAGAPPASGRAKAATSP